jgi:hypothetical protein
VEPRHYDLPIVERQVLLSESPSLRLVPTVNVHVNESGTGTRFVHVRVHYNFSIHAVDEYEAGSGTHIRARTLGFWRGLSLRHPSASHTYVKYNVQYLLVHVICNVVY